jgi:hypothetical protein
MSSPQSAVWPAFKATIDADCAAEGENAGNTFWSQARLHIITYIDRHLDHPRDEDDGQLHDIWYRFIATCQLIDADHPAQDRLVVQLLFARNIFEGLPSNGSASGGIENASHRTLNSSIAKLTSWTHLAEDIVQAWNDESIVSQRRRNLAGFIARLVALGVNATTIDTLAALAVDHLQQHLGSATDITGLDDLLRQALNDNIHIAKTFAMYCGHAIVIRVPSQAARREWDENLTALQRSLELQSEDGDGSNDTLRDDARWTQSWLKRWATTLHLGEPCW